MATAIIIAIVGIVLGLLPYLATREKEKLQLSVSLSAHSTNSCRVDLVVYNRSHEPITITGIKAFSETRSCQIALPVEIERSSGKIEVHSTPHDIFDISTLVDPECRAEFSFFIVSTDSIAGECLIIEIRTSATFFSINPKRKQITAMYSM